MKCPRTRVPLKEIEIEGIKVDISPATGGVWFDNYEFEKFDEEHESAGDKLLNILKNYSADSIDLGERITCPRNPDMIMMRHYFSSKRKIEIDECPECGGIWLDAGELMRIRELFPTEEARQQAGKEFVAEVFRNSNFLEEAKETEAFKHKTQKVVNMLKWICPSHYIPGKQKWGAF